MEIFFSSHFFSVFWFTSDFLLFCFDATTSKYDTYKNILFDCMRNTGARREKNWFVICGQNSIVCPFFCFTRFQFFESLFCWPLRIHSQLWMWISSLFTCDLVKYSSLLCFRRHFYLSVLYCVWLYLIFF